MMLLVQFLVVAVSAILASPTIAAVIPEDYSRNINTYDATDQVIVPQKREALDSLQTAPHEDGGQRYDMEGDGLDTVPLPISTMETSDLSAIQGRRQEETPTENTTEIRGQVVPCSFNLVTCF